jgi:chromatin assembly factor 1 subunit B
MKADTLMVLWHSKEPVFSVDFHSSGRLASCGADNDIKVYRIKYLKKYLIHIKIWQVAKRVDGGVSLDFLANLTRHTKAVNVVRFSPDGNFLATGSDGKFSLI